MSHPCDDPLYTAYANAVRVVFNTNFTCVQEEDAAIAAMQEARRVWEAATL